MSDVNVNRTLWHESEAGRVVLNQGELLLRVEPIIVLGEAGMGKSHLLDWLGSFAGYARCTARNLLNRHDPNTLINEATVLVVDALDEVSSQKDGEAVDLVLQKLGILGYPRFVLSCRVADWRSATGVQAIYEQYNRRPIELHLEPFSDDDALCFLASRLGLDAAESIVEKFGKRGLGGFLGNPQTLELIARAARSGSLPESKGQLFEKAIEVLRVEHREVGHQCFVSREAGLNAAGGAFAGLLLTGSEAVVRKASARDSAGDMPIAEVTTLPGTEALERMLGTRLFRSDGSERFSYWHRRIGEFLGANWLAESANTPRRRRRLLAAFQSHGLVPSSLRGMHAWLARDPHLAEAVIRCDPMGVIEYGDADNLTVQQGSWLLQALDTLSKSDPRFHGWGNYPMKGAVRSELLSEVRRLAVHADSEVGLKLLLLRALGHSSIAGDLRDDLLTIAVDASAFYGVRLAAAQALSGVVPDSLWGGLLNRLEQSGDESSLRLAIDIATSIGFGPYTDELMAQLIAGYSSKPGRVGGVVWRFEREIPLDRIDGVLESFSGICRGLSAAGKGGNDRTDFAYQLVYRRLLTEEIDVERLWRWIEPFDVSLGYHRETTERIGDFVRGRPHLRGALQRHALLGEPFAGSLVERASRMARSLPCLSVTPEDIQVLLKCLDPADRTDERWRDLITLVRHDGDIGRDVREDARLFAVGDVKVLDWIDGLSHPRKYPWEEEEEERRQKDVAEQSRSRLRARRDLSKKMKEMRDGDWRYLANPARAYLGQFHDIDGDLPAHERIQSWLGGDIADAAHLGFESFLTIGKSNPTAVQISESYAAGSIWAAEYIIAAAFFERHRKGCGFDDLTNERLIAGLIVLRHSHFESESMPSRLEELIESKLRDRGVWEEAMRVYLEPQLEAGLEYIDGLPQCMRSDGDIEVSSALAFEWLMRFPEMHERPELEMAGRLVRSRRLDRLREVMELRKGLADAGRARNWDAVGLMVDFDRTIDRLGTSAVDPALIWHIRQFTGGHFGEEANFAFPPKTLQWIVDAFRTQWPRKESPKGGWSGSTNGWDASDYLGELIARLGRNPSEEAADGLDRLLRAPSDGYTGIVQSVKAEHSRVRVEAAYAPLNLSALNSIVRDGRPTTAIDLRAFMVEELTTVQRKVRSDDVDSWRVFFDSEGVAKNEEFCRDRLLGLLRESAHSIALEPEGHVGGDKEVDIHCTAGTVRIPIEVKGQWHPELWKGADAQLDRLYTPDWRAGGVGIYLVLWFGANQPDTKQLCSPGRGEKGPNSPEELRRMLIERSTAAREGRVGVFVLDLER